MNQKLVNVLRWLAVYPACILVYAIVYLILYYTNSRPDEEGSLGIAALIAPLLGAGVASYVSMLAAYHIAPNNKDAATMFLLIFIIGLIGHEVYLLFSLGFQWGILQVIIGNILGGIGGFIVEKE